MKTFLPRKQISPSLFGPGLSIFNSTPIVAKPAAPGLNLSVGQILIIIHDIPVIFLWPIGPSL